MAQEKQESKLKFLKVLRHVLTTFQILMFKTNGINLDDIAARYKRKAENKKMLMVF